MNSEQQIFNDDIAVVALKVDYYMEAASQPPHALSEEEEEEDEENMIGDTQKSFSNDSKKLVAAFYACILLLAMATTGIAVWFIQDSQSTGNLFPSPEEAGEQSSLSDPPVSNSDPTAPLPPTTSTITPYPPLQTGDSTPLGLCQGYCGSNDDCEDGLICFQHSAYEDVPGCSGGSEDGSKTDYCASLSIVSETYVLYSIAEPIYGAPDDNFGSAVSLSQTEPLLMAVGAVDRGSTGYVKIYQLEGDNDWVLAATIQGDETGADFGHSVALSWDGRFLAAGMPRSQTITQDNYPTKGRVTVFELTKLDTTENGQSVWKQVGEDITLDDEDFWGRISGTGYSVSLSEDGRVLAIAQQYSVYAFERTDAGDWSRLGSGIRIGSYGGASVSLSGDGSRLAVNVKPFDADSYDGYGRVYEFDGDEWIQIGETLGDLSIHDTSELRNILLASASLAGDGATVAMSCIDRSAKNSYVRVYRDMGEKGWVPMGNPILSKLDQYAVASKVEITKDGAVVAIGDYASGRVRVYEFDGAIEQQWIQIGEVTSENDKDQLGLALSLAGGKEEAYLAIGGPSEFHTLGHPGFIVTYKTAFRTLQDPTPSPTSQPTELTRDPSYFSDYVYRFGNDYENAGIAGNSIGLSGNGNVFAYGLVNERSMGHVTILSFDGNWDTRLQRSQLSGIEDGDEFGYSIALSDDGLKMAIGIPNSNEGIGRVQIFELDEVGQTWTQLGSDLVGEIADDDDAIFGLIFGRFGHSVSLNDDGSILAVGAPYANLGVFIFRFENSQWVKLGDTITASAYKAALHGWSVSLSSDGLVVAIGGPTNEDNWDEAGACRIYEFINNKWQQRGQAILGEQRSGLLGTSVSLSGDGNTVAIGAINHQLPAVVVNEGGDESHQGLQAGAVLVYQYSPETNWTSLGKPIFGDAPFDRFGRAVSLTKDGKKLAAGAPDHGEGGQVRLFIIDEENMYWNQVEDLQRYDASEDEGKDGEFGTAVALVEGHDGLRLAVGAPKTRHDARLGLIPTVVGEVTVYRG